MITLQYIEPSIKHSMNKFILFSAILIFASCSSKIITLTQADADRAAKTNQNVTLTSLQEGQKLYSITCNQCHGLKTPQSRTKEKWMKVIPKMSVKAKINPEQEELITQYLLTMAKH